MAYISNLILCCGNERTSLSLDENVPFHIKNEFIIDFQMWVRNEPDFGAILHLCTNENQFLHFVFAAGDNNRNFPALVFNEGMFAINTNIEKVNGSLSLCTLI